MKRTIFGRTIYSLVLTVALVLLCTVNTYAYSGNVNATHSKSKLVAITNGGWSTFTYSATYYEYYNTSPGYRTYPYRTISQVTNSSNNPADVHAGVIPQWVYHDISSSRQYFAMYSGSFWMDPDEFSHQYATNTESVTYSIRSTKTGSMCYSIYGAAVIIPYTDVIQLSL